MTTIQSKFGLAAAIVALGLFMRPIPVFSDEECNTSYEIKGNHVCESYCCNGGDNEASCATACDGDSMPD